MGWHEDVAAIRANSAVIHADCVTLHADFLTIHRHLGIQRVMLVGLHVLLLAILVMLP